jgi:3-oxoacyl-[acyl-carrier protein] reductase
LDALTADVWDRIFAVNVKGTFYCCRAAARAMRDGGRIVNIGSVAGIRGNGSSIAYAASKAAIHTMTLSLARALAPGITVNAIAPGLIETRWHAGHDGENAGRAARFPAKRIGRPQDIAQMTVAFAAADNFLTGQVLVVDGGALL